MEIRVNNKMKYFIVSIISILNQLKVGFSLNDTLITKYSILTEGCRIPAIPVFSNNIKKIMSHTDTSNCTENIHLLDYNSTHIWVVEESLDLYNVLTTNNFYCCYRYFYAENNIAQIIYGTCIEFISIIEAKHEFTRVECYHLDIKIYDDFFLFPTFTTVNVTNSAGPDFNILLFGIESMSRVNFLRTMPKTSKFLQEKGSIQLLGYNKVGDNSFPNLFPLLFGKSYEHVKKSCIQYNVIDVSKCIFLWTKFKKDGYHTALASDSVAGLLGTYEYSLTKIPTDFYLQPFIFETRNVFQNKDYNFHQCLHNKYFYKLLLDWSAELLKKSKEKLFGVFWEESISHENFNLPKNVDNDYFLLLQQLETSKHLDNSIVILFSDHGMRWGEIAQTDEGRAENHLPLFEIMFPREFQIEYSLAFKNFKGNRYSLTSPYDIHETLLDLVQNNLKDYELMKRSKDITNDTNKLSLFLPIPNNRTCKSIGISEHWCSCQKKKNDILDEKLKMFVAYYVVNNINRLLRKYPQCHQLRIRKILIAKYREDSNSKNPSYEVTIETSPGGGIFESTLLQKGQELFISGTITRLNLYRYTSQCIKHNSVKMYCRCKKA